MANVRNVVGDVVFKSGASSLAEALSLMAARGDSLRGLDLWRADLDEFDFTGQDLTGSDFQEASLWRADFTQAKVEHSSFRRADLRGANLLTVEAAGSDFTEANLQEASFDLDLRDDYNLEPSDESLALQAKVFEKYLTPFSYGLLKMHYTGGRGLPDIRLSFALPIPAQVEARLQGSDMDTVREVFRDEVYAGVLSVFSKQFPVRSVLDLGANIGLSSLYFAWNFPQADIYAIEPADSNFELLQRNLAYGLGNTHKHRFHCKKAAVWPYDGPLFLHEHGGKLAYDSFRVRPGMVTEKPVRAMTMFEICNSFNLKFIDIVKIDIEGAEKDLFLGDRAWLHNVGCIAIEFHGNSRKLSQFDAVMQAYGFEVYTSIGEHTVIAKRRF